MSYIAMTYRWPNPDAGSISEVDNRIIPPISETMFQAVLAERQSADEGLWCDLICINQHNEEEKAISIGAMDVVYGHARKVVVALDDVTFDHNEASFFERNKSFWCMLGNLSFSIFKRLFPEARDFFSCFVSCNPEMHTILQKIFTSECFERAWCYHEIRLARSLIFLANCTKSSQSEEKCCVRMPSTAILALRHKVRMLGHKTLNGLSSNGLNVGKYLEWKSDFVNYEVPSWAPRPAPVESSQLLVAQCQVWPFKAGGNPKLNPDLRSLDANLDKLSIALNASGLCLALTARSEEDIKQASKLACFDLLWSIGMYIWEVNHSLGLLQHDWKEEEFDCVEFVFEPSEDFFEEN